MFSYAFYHTIIVIVADRTDKQLIKKYFLKNLIIYLLFQLLTDHFFPDENVCIGTEVDKNPLAGEEQLELIADAALDGLSLVAVANDTDEVVSVLINKLQVSFNRPLKEQGLSLSVCFLPKNSGIG